MCIGKSKAADADSCNQMEQYIRQREIVGIGNFAELQQVTAEETKNGHYQNDQGGFSPVFGFVQRRLNRADLIVCGDANEHVDPAGNLWCIRREIINRETETADKNQK